MSQKSGVPRRTCHWVRRSMRRAEAIRRNEKHRPVYEKQAEEKGLKDEAALAFVNHKIGIPAKRVMA